MEKYQQPGTTDLDLTLQNVVSGLFIGFARCCSLNLFFLGKKTKHLGVFGIFLVSLPKIVKTTKNNMLFEDKIKELRIQLQLPQRKLAAALDIDTATYCKIEKGERKARREQIAILSQVFNVDENTLLTLWLADKVTDMVASEQEVAPSALLIAAETIKKSV